jgi:hypothetical protein
MLYAKKVDGGEMLTVWEGDDTGDFHGIIENSSSLGTVLDAQTRGVGITCATRDHSTREVSAQWVRVTPRSARFTRYVIC